jgi:hypothetical protein
MAAIHISCPLSISEEDLQKVSVRVNDYQHWWTRWERSEPKDYKDSWIEKADAVLFILPNFHWSYKFDDLPHGQQLELKRATDYYNKPLFIAYKVSSTKELKIYSAEYKDRTISGIAGTSDLIKEFTRGSKPEVKSFQDVITTKIEVLKEVLVTDIRLLLMKR